VFLLGATVLAVAWVIVWFLPEEKLRSVSGIQARQEATAEAHAEAIHAEAIHAEAAAEPPVHNPR